MTKNLALVYFLCSICATSGEAQKITFGKAISLLQATNSHIDSTLKANGWKNIYVWEEEVTYGNTSSVQSATRFVKVKFSPLGPSYNEIEVLFRSARKFRKFARPFKTENYYRLFEHEYYGYTLTDYIEKSSGNVVVQLKKYTNTSLGQSFIFYNTAQYYKYTW